MDPQAPHCDDAGAGREAWQNWLFQGLLGKKKTKQTRQQTLLSLFKAKDSDVGAVRRIGECCQEPTRWVGQRGRQDVFPNGEEGVLHLGEHGHTLPLPSSSLSFLTPGQSMKMSCDRGMYVSSKGHEGLGRERS